MSSVQVRPTFQISTELTPREVFTRLRRIVESSPAKFEGQFASRHAMLTIAKSDRHFWSPWLHVEMRSNQESTESGREVFCRFSPHPSVWTAFMFSWLALAVLTFFSIVFGASQQIIGQPAWGYLLIPLWGVLGGILWVASQIGQKLSRIQMIELKKQVDESLAAP